MVLPSRRTLLGAAAGGVGAFGLAGCTSTESAPSSSAPFLNAREAGARGDGRTDDSAALNRAVQRLADAGGGVLWLPHGIYVLGDPLVLGSGVSVISGATGHGYIASGDTAAVILQAGDGLQGAVVEGGSDLVGGHLSGVEVRGNGKGVGIRLPKATWCSVTRCSIDACAGPGLLLESGMACVLEDLLLTNCVLDRTQDRVVGALDVAGTDHYVSRCEANASLKEKTSSSKRVAAVVLRGANHFVSDSVGEYSDVGWAVAATASRFTNVRADTNFGDGFVVTGGSNAFAACTSAGNSQDTSGADDGWVVSGAGNTFAACNVVTSPGKQVRFGFRDTANSRSAAQRNTYSACTVDEAAQAPWKTEGFLGSSPSVSPNAIRPTSGTQRIDVAQATLVVLFDFDEATTIEGFDNGVNGQTIQVLGNRFATIAASRLVQTTTGQPISMADDRVAGFTHYNGAWYQTA